MGVNAAVPREVQHLATVVQEGLQGYQAYKGSNTLHRHAFSASVQPYPQCIGGADVKLDFHRAIRVCQCFQDDLALRTPIHRVHRL